MVIAHLSIQELLASHMEFFCVVEKFADALLRNQGDKACSSFNQLFRKLIGTQWRRLYVHEESADEDTVALQIVQP